ncbi:VOC family protein [Solirubrobacter soli]|uniref:VOC family protein n=1 Tax=Solirubrobacter soli TaxID=363832 RepID=UPI000489B38E|nr:VOC family protein [Solirubrobacter soli]
MSERHEYPAGVPCWADVLVPDPGAAEDFYGDVFGWDFTEPTENGYRVARIRGLDVAGLGTLTSAMPSWNTYIRVESVEAASERATEDGGTVLVAPFDVLPAGRIAVIADPTQAVFALWEAVDREGAQLINEPGTWQMSSLHTHEPEAAAAFYQALFGWEIQEFGGATLFRLPGYVGGRSRQPIPQDVVAVMAPRELSVPPHWNVNLQVSDVDLTAEAATAQGGTLIAPPFDTPGFRNAVIQDPQGAVFSVSQLVIA